MKQRFVPVSDECAEALRARPDALGH